MTSGGSLDESDMEDEHFIVWMRTSGIPNFRKMWGRIEEGLEPGDYYILVENNYEVADFASRKSIVLMNLGLLGGRNTFLAIMYLAAGSFTAALSIGMFSVNLYKMRELVIKKIEEKQE